MANEKRKLMLWVELFDSINDSYMNPPSDDMPVEFPQEARNIIQDATKPGSETRLSLPVLTKHPSDSQGRWEAQEIVSNPFLLYFGSVGTEVKKDLVKQGKPSSAADIAAECKTRWDNSRPGDRQEWIDFYNRVVTKFKGGRLHRDTKFELTNEVLTHLEAKIDLEMDVPPEAHESVPKVHGLSNFGQRNKAGAAKAEALDYKMTYTPDFGAAILQQGKSDLLKRLGPENDKASVAESAPKMSLTNFPLRIPHQASHLLFQQTWSRRRKARKTTTSCLATISEVCSPTSVLFSGPARWKCFR
jgi:palmitoyltransferase